MFDAPADQEASHRFLESLNHHLLLALEGDRPVGFVSGFETTHPGKGTEVFLYELAVDERFCRRGIRRQRVQALAQLTNVAVMARGWRWSPTMMRR